MENTERYRLKKYEVMQRTQINLMDEQVKLQNQIKRFKEGPERQSFEYRELEFELQANKDLLNYIDGYQDTI